MQNTDVKSIVINSGAPRIEGTRVSVYDVLDHLNAGFSADKIAEVFGLSVEQTERAIEYIQRHKSEVDAAYQKIVDRNAAGNSPELLERLAKSQGKAAELRARLRRTSPAGIETHAGHPGG